MLDEPLYVDDFGNEIVSEPGRFHQYVMRDRISGELVRVCGQFRSSYHTHAYVYSLPERRYVCMLCFPGRPRDSVEADYTRVTQEYELARLEQEAM